MSYGMISILLISRCAAPPYPAAPDFLHRKACHTILRSLCSLTNRVPLPPHPGDRINRSMLSCRKMAPLLSTRSAPACGGKVVAPATKGGCIASSKARLACFPSGEARSSGFRRQRRHKKWRPSIRAPTSPAQRYYITPEGGALNLPVRRSRSQAEPLAPRAGGPAAPSTLAAKPRQPSGIQRSTE